jgi:hypothetical protein
VRATLKPIILSELHRIPGLLSLLRLDRDLRLEFDLKVLAELIIEFGPLLSLNRLEQLCPLLVNVDLHLFLLLDLCEVFFGGFLG